MKFVPIDKIPSLRPPNTSKMKRNHGFTPVVSSVDEDGWSTTRRKSKRMNTSSTPELSISKLNVDFSHEDTSFPRNLNNSIGNIPQIKGEVNINNNKKLKSIKNNNLTDKINYQADNSNESTSSDIVGAISSTILVEKESIEHEKAKKDIFKNGDPDKMGTPHTNQKSDSVQTNQVPLTKTVSSAKKGSGCLSVDLATATLQTKQVSLNKRDTPSNLEVGSSSFTNINNGSSDWSAMAEEITGTSADNKLRTSFHFSTSKQLQLLSTILSSSHPKENFFKAVQSDTILLKLFITYDGSYWNHTIGDGLCFIRVEKQLETRAISTGEITTPSDFNLSIESNRNDFINYINSNSTSKTRNIESKIITYLNKKPFKTNYPKSGYQSEDFTSHWCSALNHKSMFIKVFDTDPYAFLSYSSSAPSRKTYFTYHELLCTLENSWNRACYSREHFFLLPVGTPDLDLQRFHEALDSLFNNLLNTYKSLSSISQTKSHEIFGKSPLQTHPGRSEPEDEPHDIESNSQNTINDINQSKINKMSGDNLTTRNNQSKNITSKNKNNKINNTQPSIRNTQPYKNNKSKQNLNQENTGNSTRNNNFTSLDKPNTPSSQSQQPTPTNKTNQTLLNTNTQTETWDDIIKYLMSRSPTTENNISVSKIHIAQKVYCHVIQHILDAVSGNDETNQIIYLKKLLLLPTWFFTIGDKESLVINRAQQMLKNIWPDIHTSNRPKPTKHSSKKPKSNKFKFNQAGSQQSEKIKRALHHISEGLISKGFKTLEEKPPLDITPDTLQKLQNLHPKRKQDIVRITDHRAQGDIRFDEKVVRDTIMNLPKGKASGFTQLRSIHLRLLLGAQSDIDGEKFLKLFTILLSHMANGILPKEFYSTLACSILIPIAKDSTSNPGVRPIALGDTLNKVVSKMLLKMSKDSIEKVFHPFQLGISFSNAAEIISHSVESIRLNNPSYDIAQLDMHNAFNSINRQATLNECLKTFPMLFPYFNAMYCDESKLLVRSSDGSGKYTALTSSEGSRQGDTLGSLFFCIGALPLLKSIMNVLDESRLFAYIDDISIIGPPDEISKAIKLVNSEAPNFGLKLNLNKCLILQGANKYDYSDIIENKQIRSARNSGIEILGTPIGDNSYITVWLEQKYLELKNDAELIKSVPDKQCEWLLLYYVLRNKLTYIMRTVNPALFKNITTDIKNVFIDLLQDIIGNHIELKQYHHMLASLPFTAGGCGLNFYYLNDISVSAYVASAITAYQFMIKEDIVLQDNDLWYENNLVQFVHKHSLNCGKDLEYDEILKEIDTIDNNSVNKLQKKLTDELIDTHTEQFKSLINNNKDISARYENVCDENSSKFLLAIPRHGSTTFTNQEFITTLSLKLIIPLFQTNSIIKCNCNKNIMLDQYCDHLLTCSLRNEWKARHDNFARGISDLAKDAGLHVRLDTGSNRMFEPNGKRLFTDLTFFNSPLHNGKTVRYDVSVTHSTTKDHDQSNITRRETIKNKKYSETSDLNGVLFKPLVVTSQGVYSNDTANLISNLCNEIAKRVNRPYSVIKHNSLVRLSCILQKANASIIINKLDSILSKQLYFTPVDRAHINYHNNLVIIE